MYGQAATDLAVDAKGEDHSLLTRPPFKKVSRISTLKLMPQGGDVKSNMMLHPLVEAETGSEIQEKDEQSDGSPPMRLSARNMTGGGSSFHNSRSSLINLSKYRDELKQEQRKRSAQRRYMLLEEKGADKLNYDQLVANFVKPLPTQAGSQGPWSYNETTGNLRSR